MKSYRIATLMHSLCTLENLLKTFLKRERMLYGIESLYVFCCGTLPNVLPHNFVSTPSSDFTVIFIWKEILFDENLILKMV